MIEPKSGFEFIVSYEGPMKMAYSTRFTLELPATLKEVKKKALADFWVDFNDKFPGRMDTPHGSYEDVKILVRWKEIINDAELHRRMEKTHNFQATFSTVSHVDTKVI